MKAITVGAGIGGLTTALFMNKHGINCEVFERAPAIQESGVGINLMPQAITSFDEICNASGAGRGSGRPTRRPRRVMTALTARCVRS
jgi:2-polyprenyl-6-methoxyphenol hydroxylase-like FAD-dependent oxidoreductase